MAYLVDTSILVRLANTADELHGVASQSVLKLHQRGETQHIAPQNLVEFRGVATRPKQVNGLGLSTTDAERKSAVFEATFPILQETPQIFPAWKVIVEALGVIGKQVHDARPIAICNVYGVTNLLTFNIGHFKTLAAFGPGVVIVHPADV